MAVSLRYLCKYAKENYGMNLICGEKSLDNLVNWVHMLEDPAAGSFLHGEELIFSTGIGFSSADWLIDFAKTLVKYGASGLVLNIGPYIRSVPEELTAYCKEVQFPLFTIPWKTRIVDITNDFCRKIIKSEENAVTVAGAFRNAIFFPEKQGEYRQILELKEFDLHAGFCAAVISPHTSSPDVFNEYDKTLRMLLSRILYLTSDRFSIFRHDKTLVAVLQGFSAEQAENAFEKLAEMSKSRDESSFTAAVGSTGEGIDSLGQSYRRAVALLPVAERQGKRVLSYEKTGLYQLLLEISDDSLLRRYCDETMKPLIEYDQKHRTDYMETLKLYLEHNGSVQEVAAKTYVHRNTINYKLKKIREILRTDLSYNDGLSFLLALYIKDIL